MAQKFYSTFFRRTPPQHPHLSPLLLSPVPPLPGADVLDRSRYSLANFFSYRADFWLSTNTYAKPLALAQRRTSPPPPDGPLLFPFSNQADWGKRCFAYPINCISPSKIGKRFLRGGEFLSGSVIMARASNFIDRLSFFYKKSGLSCMVAGAQNTSPRKGRRWDRHVHVAAHPGRGAPPHPSVRSHCGDRAHAWGGGQREADWLGGP